MLFFVSIACASAICGLLDDFHTRYVVLGRDLEDKSSQNPPGLNVSCFPESRLLGLAMQ